MNACINESFTKHISMQIHRHSQSSFTKFKSTQISTHTKIHICKVKYNHRKQHYSLAIITYIDVLYSYVSVYCIYGKHLNMIGVSEKPCARMYSRRGKVINR